MKKALGILVLSLTCAVFAAPPPGRPGGPVPAPAPAPAPGRPGGPAPAPAPRPAPPPPPAPKPWWQVW